MVPASVLAQAAREFDAPAIDWHALAPEVVVTVTVVVVLLVDLFTDRRSKWTTSSLAGIGLLGALLPVITLAADGTNRSLYLSA